MKKISINNFLKMTPSVPQYSDKNQNWLIAGADPLYYLGNFSPFHLQEEQLAPLVASHDWTQITGTVTGNVMSMITSVDSTYEVYAVTDDTKVLGITTSAITDLGYPTGASVSDVGGRLAIQGGILFMTYTAGTVVYKMTIPGSAWTNFGTLHNTYSPHYLEPFLDFVAVSDGNTAGGTTNQMVRKIDVTAFTTTSDALSLDLGKGYGVLQMKNLNNKYLAIAATQIPPSGLTTIGYPQNYIFLWDGIQDRYNYAVKVPGFFLDMKVVDGILYVAVAVARYKTCIYYLSGTSLKKVITPQISQVVSPFSFRTAQSLFDYKNYLGIILNTTNDITNPVMVYGKDEVGELEYIFSYGKFLLNFTVGHNGNLFTNEYIASSNSKIYYLYEVTKTYQPIFYKSQWIPIKNLSGIDIVYDSPPAVGTDAINVTIYGRGEDIISGSSTTVLDPITPTNYLNTSRTRLDVKGFTGDRVLIQLSTINTGTWRPIIRSVDLITQ